MKQSKEPYSPPACDILVLQYGSTVMTLSNPNSAIDSAEEEDWGLLGGIVNLI
jgi:hypothetical protein